MKQGPLTENELQWLDDTLEHYASDNSVIDVSELDGYLTAILSAPVALEPEFWMVALWGGEKHIPQWRNSRERDRFMDLTFQHMADIEERLVDFPEQFEPLFGEQELEGQVFTVIDDWCYGYMRGIGLVNLPPVSEQLQPAYQLIALHGTEDHAEEVNALSAEQFESNIAALPSAVLDLYQYWLFYAQQNTPQPKIAETKVGRNDPCPCGSGKKFKQCCLH
ncbi:YecA family protein [Rosenbergiella australiborealis]|uniref:YecA family protein n=1 Tax=Rosenbergiella australiborealis TaxID=1544696 RepID=A0ABS5T456_9GAMM|nr:YecA family protein [Rosenbergiella australiborealis]MBT0727133.1 YecA family protein [Rosenbergiella australiborealis]